MAKDVCTEALHAFRQNPAPLCTKLATDLCLLAYQPTSTVVVNYCVSKIPRVLVLKWQLHMLLVGQLLKQVHFPQGYLMPWSFT